MTTAAHLDPIRPERSGFAQPASDRSARCAPTARDPARIRGIALLVLPGVWVLVVVGLSLVLGERVQFTPLLAAAPAIACAGTGRRQCVVLGSACALFALIPLPGEPATIRERLGTLLAILFVAGASYLVAQRRVRMQRAYDEVRRIADVTQHVLLRPIPERIGPVAAAVEYLAAVDGARIGGDFYEVIESPFGIRAMLGDMRGSGLDAVSGAAALLGAFREAGAVESALETVAARLDAALARHATAARGRRSGAGSPSEYQGLEDGTELCAEDFATAVLVEFPEAGESGTGVTRGVQDAGIVRELSESGTSAAYGAQVAETDQEVGGFEAGAGYGVRDGAIARDTSEPGADVACGVQGAGTGREVSEAGTGAACGAQVAEMVREVSGPVTGAGRGAQNAQSPHAARACEARLVVCGHPAPYLVRSGQVRPLEPECPTLPLGLGSLVGEPYAVSASTVVFEPGDALVLYTDGISDARSRSGEFFPLGDALRELADLAPGAVTGRVRSRLLEYTRGALNDDAALLVLQACGVDA